MTHRRGGTPLNANHPIDLARIFEKIHLHYDAICLFSVSKDAIYQLKFPVEGNDVLNSGRSLCWSEALWPVVRDIIAPEDQQAVYDFLLPGSVLDALTNENATAEIVFRSQNEHWKKIILHPLSFTDGLVDDVLYLLIDQTLTFGRFQHLKALSERDELTDLFNRTKLLQLMQEDYKNLKSCGVLFFDMNNLKTANDTHGHDAGDRLICLVAESLRSVVNRSVHAFRYGGDEFLVVAENCLEEQMDTLILMCRNRLGTLSRRAGVTVSVAVGKAWSAAPCDIHTLIHRADRDMYRDKRRMKTE